jgi:hypothetical protein
VHYRAGQGVFVTPFPVLPRELFESDQQYREHLVAHYSADIESEIKAIIIALAIVIPLAVFVYWRCS